MFYFFVIFSRDFNAASLTNNKPFMSSLSCPVSLPGPPSCTTPAACLVISLAVLKSKTGNGVFQNYGSLDRLVPPTRTATTAGGGFPTQSQRRWWKLEEWRYYLRQDKTEKLPQKLPLWLCLYSAPLKLQQRAISGGRKGRQPAADGRGRTTARAHSVVFVGHMHASEN